MPVTGSIIEKNKTNKRICFWITRSITIMRTHPWHWSWGQMGLWAATSRAFSSPKAGEFARWCDPQVTSVPSKVWISRSATATLATSPPLKRQWMAVALSFTTWSTHALGWSIQHRSIAPMSMDSPMYLTPLSSKTSRGLSLRVQWSLYPVTLDHQHKKTMLSTGGTRHLIT